MRTMASVLILIGAAFHLLGAVGLLRFEGVLARMHAATKPLTIGLAATLGGAALVAGESGDTAKLLLIVALQFIAAPISAHMVGRAVYRTSEEARGRLSVDELGDRESV